MQGPVIIVDGYSAGQLLAPEFKIKGVRCFHVQSTREIWPIFLPSFRPEDYQANFAFDGDFPALLKWASEVSPIAVLPGTETGVELADRLSSELHLNNSNGTEFSAARRDKHLMIERCRQAGIRVAKQLKTDNPSAASQWYEETKQRKIVVKPVESAGTDGVSICLSKEEVARAVEAIVGKTNKLGLLNSHALVQEFLEGTEYFLNAVSFAGRHHFTDIWRYQKRSLHGHDCVYDKNILCPASGADEIRLQSYVRSVLTALNIGFGPTHTEVMLGPDGPALVEVGCRLDGLSVVGFNRGAVGFSPVDMTVSCYANPESMHLLSPAPYTIRKHARTVYLTSYVNGVIASIPGEEKLRQLRSCYQLRLRVKPGSKVEKTTNYFNAPGFLSLLHEDREVLEEDYWFIREFERKELFEYS